MNYLLTFDRIKKSTLRFRQILTMMACLALELERFSKDYCSLTLPITHLIESQLGSALPAVFRQQYKHLERGNF